MDHVNAWNGTEIDDGAYTLFYSLVRATGKISIPVVDILSRILPDNERSKQRLENDHAESIHMGCLYGGI